MNTTEIAEINISYSSKIKRDARVRIKNSSDAYELFLSNWNMNLIEIQEEFKFLLLNNNSDVIGIHSLSKGATNGVNVDVKLIFAISLKACASAIIIAHNHPSGNLKPSKMDISLTEKIKKASKFLDIQLLDHLIITKEAFLSLSDENKM